MFNAVKTRMLWTDDLGQACFAALAMGDLDIEFESVSQEGGHILIYRCSEFQNYRLKKHTIMRGRFNKKIWAVC